MSRSPATPTHSHSKGNNLNAKVAKKSAKFATDTVAKLGSLRDLCVKAFL